MHLFARRCAIDAIESSHVIILSGVYGAGLTFTRTVLCASSTAWRCVLVSLDATSGQVEPLFRSRLKRSDDGLPSEDDDEPNSSLSKMKFKLYKN